MSVSAAARGDPLAGLDRAGQRDHVDVGVGDERLAGRVVVAAGDDVEHARGQELGRELGQPQRRQRRRLGGLEHDRVAGRQRRADLPDRHHQRVVPRRDLADHADRLAPDPATCSPRGTRPRPCPRGCARRRRRSAGCRPSTGISSSLTACERLAGVARLELGELVARAPRSRRRASAARARARPASCSTSRRTRARAALTARSTSSAVGQRRLRRSPRRSAGLSDVARSRPSAASAPTRRR